MDPFTLLGDFEIAHLVEYLPPVDLIRLQLVSKHWRAVLNSPYISRIALLHHFPHVPQSRDLRDSHTRADAPSLDVTLLWRRVVYQYHTRRTGQPTRMHQVLLNFADAMMEWDVGEGKVAWISNRTDKVLRVKNLEGDGEVREIDISPWWLEEDEEGVAGYLRVQTLKIVKGLVILSMEYSLGWGGYDHPSFSGSRAKFIVIDLCTGELAWKYRMHPQQTILGELEWSEGKLFYLRRTPILSFDGLDTSARSLVHFVIHDMFTGDITAEMPLENGNDVVAYRFLSYDVMVVDRPLKHFILVRDHCETDTRLDLLATIYTLSGKIVGKFLIYPEDITSGERNVARNIFVDFTHRHDVFNITETFFCDFSEPMIPAVLREAGMQLSSRQKPPKAVLFNSWSIAPERGGTGFAVEQRRYESPIVAVDRVQSPTHHIAGDIGLRGSAEILFSTLDVGVICYDMGSEEIGIDVAVYEERPKEEQNLKGIVRHEQVTRRRITDKRIVNSPGREVVKQAEGDLQIGKFDKDGGLQVKGEVHCDYWYCVKWLDRYLTFHTWWGPYVDDPPEGSGILVLDFHPPW
ncbi:uncharacterized protein LAJ45_09846 [Morchella importuna]|uniref:uncharacterized protein n=1 Tax=Morchella importuna TaxID=1174673 RepID=UPI001E8CAA16|nr:uncharacterized protein LAJ45_09846 [Morchella importuna]KAH8146156.1 hypothetical protein LAJ45_09846 [Morchella importuna]